MKTKQGIFQTQSRTTRLFSDTKQNYRTSTLFLLLYYTVYILNYKNLPQSYFGQ